MVQKRRWLRPQKTLTNVKIGWISSTEERDHLNIEKLTALFVVMHINYFVNIGYVKCDTNMLKMHMCANIKKALALNKNC